MKNTLIFNALSKALSAAVLIGLGLSGQAVAATYSYTGNNFTLFSCGPSSPGPGTLLCSTPAPTNTLTTYKATDHVTATLTLTSALPASYALTDVRTLPGFALTMSDGEHTVTNADAVGMFAQVATDATGQISQWVLVINTGGFLNGGVATVNTPGNVFDQGVLACCDPNPPGNLGLLLGAPATWGGGTISPATAVSNLISLVFNPTTGLTFGQISSFTDKLNNALASIQAGLNKQAINQLNAFIVSVQTAEKNNKVNVATGTELITAAQAIIAQLS
jgi:hypothetical protein